MSLVRAALTLSRKQITARAFSTSSRCLVASNFGMPAMSPTMTEGGIVDWKFKEGDSFAAGDILLEIETDKAQIDVEAQDDGLLAKIYVESGVTGIPVGKTIAVLAEAGDDLATLEIPKPEEGRGAAPAAPAAKPAEKPAPKAESAPAKSAAPKDTSTESSDVFTKANLNQTLLPSVLTLAQENGLSNEDILEKVLASGPNGRVLKGDVLAFLGKVERKDVGDLATFIKKHEHLDLSKIVVKKATASEPSAPKSAPAKADKTEKPAKAAPPPKPQPVVLNSFYLLEELSALQAQLQATLGSPISLKTLVEKASQLALKDANTPKHKKSILYDPLFESIVAPNTLGKTAFSVSIKYPKPAAPSPAALAFAAQSAKADIYDAITGFSKPKKTATVSTAELLKVDVTVNDKYPGAAAKAKVYLDRFGYYLAQGKGDLIL